MEDVRRTTGNLRFWIQVQMLKFDHLMENRATGLASTSILVQDARFLAILLIGMGEEQQA